MSMSTHVVGYRQADDKWEAMKKIWDQCDSVGIEPPLEVVKFFDHTHPLDLSGKEVTLGDAVQKWPTDSGVGYQVDLTKIPEGVTILRFYNSY